MISLAKEPFQVLNQKLRALEHDVAELARITSSAAGERIDALTGGMKQRYEESSKAAKEYVVENPAKTALFAGIAGFAIGYVVRFLWRKP